VVWNSAEGKQTAATYNLAALDPSGVRAKKGNNSPTGRHQIARQEAHSSPEKVVDDPLEKVRKCLAET